MHVAVTGRDGDCGWSKRPFSRSVGCRETEKRECGRQKIGFLALYDGTDLSGLSGHEVHVFVEIIVQNTDVHDCFRHRGRWPGLLSRKGDGGGVEAGNVSVRDGGAWKTKKAIRSLALPFCKNNVNGCRYYQSNNTKNSHQHDFIPTSRLIQNLIT